MRRLSMSNHDNHNMDRSPFIETTLQKGSKLRDAVTQSLVSILEISRHVQTTES
jgi:hypothetical protein